MLLKVSRRKINLKSICFYHKADLDGKCSAAIVKYFNSDIKLIPYDYNDLFPWEEIDKDTQVYMVDISLPTNDMYKLNNECKELIYIDHHISKLKDLDLFQFKGLQVDGTAACVLTWYYLIGSIVPVGVVGTTVPLGVELLGRYDIWDINPNVLNYQYGIRALNLDPNDTTKWLNCVFRNDLKHIISDGEKILKYVEMSQKEAVNNFAFKMIWKGYNVLAMCKTTGSSLIFKDHPDYLTADILMVFGWIGKIWKISLYTTKKEIDVSEIAKSLGGGGHRSASGFVCVELPFKLGKIV
jgi:oligoribonuclease NrnB/cAMP/cGMP phosphodiesterase (DHH superfamily)